jgi:hypothetical protein
LHNTVAPEFESPRIQLAITELINHAPPGFFLRLGPSI